MSSNTIWMMSGATGPGWYEPWKHWPKGCNPRRTTDWAARSSFVRAGSQDVLTPCTEPCLELETEPTQNCRAFRQFLFFPLIQLLKISGDRLDVLVGQHGGNAHHGRIGPGRIIVDRKSTRLNSSHVRISYAVFCLKKKKKKN